MLFKLLMTIGLSNGISINMQDEPKFYSTTLVGCMERAADMVKRVDAEFSTSMNVRVWKSLTTCIPVEQADL